LAYAIKVEILFKDITVTREGSWTPSVGFVPKDIGTINGVDVNFDEDGNVLEGEDVLDDEPNLNREIEKLTVVAWNNVVIFLMFVLL
jgi:hypothetical protein